MPFANLDIGGPPRRWRSDHSGGNRINFDMRVEPREAVNRVDNSPARALLMAGKSNDICLGGDVRDSPGVRTEVFGAEDRGVRGGTGSSWAPIDSHYRRSIGWVRGRRLRACVES